MSETTNNINVDGIACPSLDEMLRYKDGALNSHESHSIEKHLLGCSMCSEVIDEIDHESIVEMGALSASIDQKVDQRISEGGSSGFNFNGFIMMTATFVTVLLLVGNMFIGKKENYYKDISPITIENYDGVKELETVESEEKEINHVSSEELSLSENDSSESNVEEEELLVSDEEKSVVDLEKQPSATEDTQNQLETSDVTSNEIIPAEKFLTASVELIAWEVVGQLASDKGSTDKKVKIRKKGYVPEFEENEGFPIYRGAGTLKGDLVESINALHISLGEGGDFEVKFTVQANGLLKDITVDDKISETLAQQIRGVIVSLPAWIPGNVELQYKLRVFLQ